MNRRAAWTHELELRFESAEATGEMKKTVIVSSLILPELADVCTRVGMIEKGHMIVDGMSLEVMRKARQRILLNISVKESPDKAARLLEHLTAWKSLAIGKNQILEVTLKPNVEDYSDLPSLLIQAGFSLKLFREEEVNLETHSCSSPRDLFSENFGLKLGAGRLESMLQFVFTSLCPPSLLGSDSRTAAFKGRKLNRDWR